MEWQSLLPVVVGIVAIGVAVVAVGHVILNKRDVRSAIGWVGLIVLSPLLGTFVYSLFGINRIQRRASRLIGPEPPPRAALRLSARSVDQPDAAVRDRFDDRIARLALAIHHATGREILSGNSVVPLIDGDEAYPEMLRAIETAHMSILLTTYIFDHDESGCRFVEALAGAVDRGVEVRVLIDGVGARYSRPSILHALRDRGVTAKLFLPPRIPILPKAHFNLRNHRKVLLIDGRVAFAGGLNIRHGCVLAEDPDDPVQDLHFILSGPVLEPLFQIVAEDWLFATGENLDGPAWNLETEPAGEVGIQAFGDGPDEDFEALRWTLLAALTAARDRICIATPYFLPDTAILAGLRLAAMRGVQVDILLPERNNLLAVQWATMAQLWQVLEPGCRVWLVPPPFDHSKLFVVDGVWSLVGSANWDPRSLRLNFELGLACYDTELASKLMRLAEKKMRQSRELTLEEVDGRPLPIRLRDGVARLLTPYL